jgi:cell division septation protein DedD
MEQGWSNRRHSLKLYIPSRCAIVLAPFEFAVKHKEVKMPDYSPTDPAFSCYLPKQPESVAQKKEEQKASVDTKVEENKQEEPKPAESKPEEKPSEEKPAEAQPKPKEKKKLIDLMEDLTLA